MPRAAMQEPASVNPQRVIKRAQGKQQGTPSLLSFYYYYYYFVFWGFFLFFWGVLFFASVYFPPNITSASSIYLIMIITNIYMSLHVSRHIASMSDKL